MSGALCQRCKSLHLESLFETRTMELSSVVKMNKELGSYCLATLRQNPDCPFCHLLLQLIENDKTTLNSTNKDLEMMPFGLSIGDSYGTYVGENSRAVRVIPWLYIKPRWPIEYDPDITTDAPTHFLHIQRLVSSKYGPLGDKTCYGLGRRIGRTADLTLLKSWLGLCCSEHPHCTPDTTPGGTPDLVIDVGHQCVVPAPKECRYAALSYVWGDASKQLKLTDETRKRFMSSNSLATAWPDVPTTIRHAMQLCQVLGVSFLWVDALCIHQKPRRGSEDVWGADISKKMQYIYQGAFFTIVAAAGTDCWAGLPAFAGCRGSEQFTANVNGLLLAGFDHDQPHCVKLSKWHSRAWTLQERVLSKRLMIFTDDRVFWECGTAFLEDIHLERDPGLGGHGPVLDAFTNDMMIFEQTQIEGFGGYLNLVQDFTSRQLSFQKDALAAFDGVLSYIGEKLETGFLWGLPTAYFELAILFKMEFYDPNKRRQGFPSWTWAGWNQAIQADTDALTFTQWSDTGFIAVPTIFHDEYQPIAIFLGPKRDNLTDGLETITFELLDGIAEPESLPSTRLALTMDLSVLDQSCHNQVIIASSFVARLCLSQAPVADTPFDFIKTYAIILPNRDSSVVMSRKIGEVSVSTSWRMSQSDFFYFIAIGKEHTQEGATYIHTLMVGITADGMAERIQAVMFLDADWTDARPQHSTMYLV